MLLLVLHYSCMRIRIWLQQDGNMHLPVSSLWHGHDVLAVSGYVIRVLAFG